MGYTIVTRLVCTHLHTMYMHTQACACMHSSARLSTVLRRTGLKTSRRTSLHISVHVYTRLHTRTSAWCSGVPGSKISRRTADAAVTDELAGCASICTCTRACMHVRTCMHHTYSRTYVFTQLLCA